MRPRACFPTHFCSFLTFEKNGFWTDEPTDGWTHPLRDARMHLKMKYI